MTKEDYKKLNNYLNECFKRLEEHHFFMLRNIDQFCEMSDRYVHVLNQYEFNDEEPKESNLTFEEVYVLAREIIEDINPLYLTEYDKILSNGELDFSYESKYFTSHFRYSSESKLEQININRKFNYLDVCSVVHEFMHKTNLDINLPNETPTRAVLTEFMSIYFEEYAKRYLLSKGISKDELYFNERIITTKKTASGFNWYGLILLVYEMIGKVDEESYLFLREYYLPITKEGFEEECDMVISKINEVEEKYKIEIMYERDFDEKEIYNRCTRLLGEAYKYIFGTLLAYYALDNVDKDKMVWLNDHMNDEDMTVLDGLDNIGIELDEIPIMDLVKNVEKNIEIGTKKKR